MGPQRSALIPRQGCKACESRHVAWINEQLLAGVSDNAIAKELTARGEKFSHVNIGNHKRSHLVRANAALDQLVQELEQEARMAPPTVAAVYHVLINQLKSLENAKPSADTAIKAAEAIARITGMRTQQALLIAYAERAFTSSQPTALPAATTVRQLEAS